MQTQKQTSRFVGASFLKHDFVVFGERADIEVAFRDTGDQSKGSSNGLFNGFAIHGTCRGFFGYILSLECGLHGGGVKASQFDESIDAGGTHGIGGSEVTGALKNGFCVMCVQSCKFCDPGQLQA